MITDDAKPVRACPVCGAGDPVISIKRDRLPIFQNVVYPDRDAALNAVQAPFALGTCSRCGFSFNAVFDGSLVVYDANYDNFVASDVFKQYYRELARMMIERLGLTDGTVYDVGCGDGEFLKILCELAPGIRGVGIDPSCTPGRSGNVELIQSTFHADLFDSDARLVILRHVLEHIEEPVSFLGALRAAMPQAPLYVEVPDLAWILKNGAFWDFCYEHSNYFTMASLSEALKQAGFKVFDQRRSFGDQYQWAFAMPGSHETAAPPSAASAVDDVEAYARQESRRLEEIVALADSKGGLVLWGMSTKGVVLSTLLPNGSVRGGIDMNAAKQERFAAGSGVQIHSPAWLASQPGNVAVVAMNPNYLNEIRGAAAAIRPDADIVAI